MTYHVPTDMPPNESEEAIPFTGTISGAITGGITSNHCFVAGTLIVTATGYEAIENIRPRDKVYAVDSDTGEVALKSVVQTYVNDADELIHLQLNTKDTTGEELVTTSGHPFFIYGRGYEFAGNLRAGDILVNLNGEKVVLEQVQHEILESPVKVYNFEVEDYHTYFVGKEEVWVHNMCRVNPDLNAGKVSNVDLTPGKNFKQHFLKHKKLLENVTKKKYTSLKINGPEFLEDLSNMVNNGDLQFVGQGTLNKTAELANIYRGEGLTLVTHLDGTFWTLLKSGEGMDNAIQFITKILR